MKKLIITLDILFAIYWGWWAVMFIANKAEPNKSTVACAFIMTAFSFIGLALEKASRR